MLAGTTWIVRYASFSGSVLWNESDIREQRSGHICSSHLGFVCIWALCCSETLSRTGGNPQRPDEDAGSLLWRPSPGVALLGYNTSAKQWLATCADATRTLCSRTGFRSSEPWCAGLRWYCISSQLAGRPISANHRHAVHIFSSYDAENSHAAMFFYTQVIRFTVFHTHTDTSSHSNLPLAGFWTLGVRKEL